MYESKVPKGERKLMGSSKELLVYSYNDGTPILFYNFDIFLFVFCLLKIYKTVMECICPCRKN